jgi:hypothetical protein
MLSGEATNTNFIVFGLTRPGLQPTIYRTITPPMQFSVCTYYTIPQELETEDPNEFRNYFRIDKPTVNILLENICSSWFILCFPVVFSVPITNNVVSSNPVQARCTDTTLCDKVCQ